ncbi:MAG: DUF3179 domain-containing protein [Nitrospirota bacterium]|nr:MAG: DUF3179 domain-containing protein [Nitrospirota bacterium]
MKKAIAFFLLILGVSLYMLNSSSYSSAIKVGDKTFLIDRAGEKWDITQAVSIGFKPERFEFGLGRNAFTPLNDNFLTDPKDGTSNRMRVIGISKGHEAKAFSLRRMARHEITNSSIGGKPVAVGF